MNRQNSELAAWAMPTRSMMPMTAFMPPAFVSKDMALLPHQVQVSYMWQVPPLQAPSATQQGMTFGSSLPVWMQGHSIPQQMPSGSPAAWMPINPQAIHSSAFLPVQNQRAKDESNTPMLSTPPLHADGSMSPSRKKKRLASVRTTNEDEEVEEKVAKSKRVMIAKRKRIPNPDMSLNGERRLIIHFESYGVLGEFPQTFGKARRTIPDGVRGQHTLYNERWFFKVSHSPVVMDDEERPVVQIIWEITNIASSHTTRRVETIGEAVERMNNGRTITNDVFREAMEIRAKELDVEADEESNSCRGANLRSRAQALRPRCFNQGILVFGLQHRVVQDELRKRYGASVPSKLNPTGLTGPR